MIGVWLLWNCFQWYLSLAHNFFFCVIHTSMLPFEKLLFSFFNRIIQSTGRQFGCVNLGMGLTCSFFIRHYELLVRREFQPKKIFVDYSVIRLECTKNRNGFEIFVPHKLWCVNKLGELGRAFCNARANMPRLNVKCLNGFWRQNVYAVGAKLPTSFLFVWSI